MKGEGKMPEAGPDANAQLPDRVFSAFIDALSKSGVPQYVVSGLRTALLEEQDLSERRLRAAILGEESSGD